MAIEEGQAASEGKIPLPKHCRPHILSGTYEGFWECHIEPDWLLIYKINLDK